VPERLVHGFAGGAQRVGQRCRMTIDQAGNTAYCNAPMPLPPRRRTTSR
jgi:hypothetical protein